jgi:hypothetical protein
MVAIAAAAPVSVQCLSARFVEDGAGTYTATFSLPPNAVLLDIIATAEALWTAATSASLEVGNADDPDGFLTAVDLKATDLLAGQSVSIGGGTDVAGGVAGADAVAGTNTHIVDRFYSATETYEITATVVSVGAGTAGRTRVDVLYAVGNPTEVTQ